MHKDKQKRPSPISYRPPQNKREDFTARVQASGLSTNAYINECVFGKSRHRPAERKALAELLATSAQIKTTLHAIKLTEASAHGLPIEQAIEELMLIRNGIMRLLGRRS